MVSEQVTEIADGLTILRALESIGGRPVDWAQIDERVLDRGAHVIFPLAVAQIDDRDDRPAPTRLQDDTQRLERDCIHLYGGDWFHAELRLDTEAGYGRRLVESASLLSTPRYWWGIGRFAVVIIRAIDQTREFETLALHVIPKEWVWTSPIAPSTKRDASHLRRVLREQETVGGVADVVWSWPAF